MKDVEKNEQLVTMARIGKPHGIKGWLRIYSYTEPPTNLVNYPIFNIASGSIRRKIEMDQLKQQGTGLIAHFKGYDQPEQAQELVGLELQVDKTELQELNNGEYYWHQLIGLVVVNLAGEQLGVVERLIETGANDVMVVRPDDGSIDKNERLIPYLPESVVKNIDLEKQLIEVDWGSDYLM